MNDLELIDKIKEGDSAALIEFTSKYEGLILSQFNKFYGSGQSGISDESLEVSYKAAKSYDPVYGTAPSTWVGNVAKFHALKLAKERNDRGFQTTLEEAEFAKVAETMPVEENHNNFLDWFFYLSENSADERINTIMQMRYCGDKETRKFETIAKKLGISRPLVINIHDNFLKLVKNKVRSGENLDII